MDKTYQKVNYQKVLLFVLLFGNVSYMEKLRLYLNSLSTDQQKDFALACGTTIGYLRKAISEKQSIGILTSVRIEHCSDRHVTRIDLHPDTYAEYWPELAQAA